MSIYKKKCYTDQKKLEQVNIFTFLRSFFIKWYFSIKNKYYLAIYCPIFDQGSTPPPIHTPSSPALLICDDRIHAQLCLTTMKKDQNIESQYLYF